MARKKESKNGFHLKYIPAGKLDAFKELADTFPFIQDKTIALYKLVETFSSILERCEAAKTEFVPVHYDTLRKKIGIEKGVKLILSSMVDKGILAIDKSTFSIGVSSYSYKPIYTSLEIFSISRNQLRKTMDKVLSNDCYEEELSNELQCYMNVMKKITMCDDVYDIVDTIPYNHSSVPSTVSTKESISTHHSFVPYSLLLKESLKAVSTPYHSCVPYKTIGELPWELIPVFKIMAGKFKVNRPVANSRVYSNITNLKREYRDALLLDGKQLLGFDIRNSQPLLAAIIFREISLEQYGEIKPDVLQYQKECEAGTFYEYFMKLNAVDVNDQKARTEFKKQFFAKVFYSMNYEKQPQMLQQFIAKYPTCYEAMYQLKGGKWFSRDYKNFPAMMTILETEIIWETNMELINEGYDVVNIFDSIYTNDDKVLEAAKQKVIKKFAKYKIVPSLKNTHKASNVAVQVPTENEQLKIQIMKSEIMNPYTKGRKAVPDNSIDETNAQPSINVAKVVSMTNPYLAKRPKSECKLKDYPSFAEFYNSELRWAFKTNAEIRQEYYKLYPQAV